MGQLIADRRDMDFVIYEQMQAMDLTQKKPYKGLNKKLFDMIITEARNLALKELLPTNAEGDRQGVRFENGNVYVPECFHKAYNLIAEGEWAAISDEPEYGGQGLPHIITAAVNEFIIGGNYPLADYAIMSHGTAKMIEVFGTPEQKDLFLKKIYTSKWAGTMLLTEPQAGSDVGALTTSAVKNPDGTYSITGTKIFITNGEHDLTENIIHPVLARIEGAPAGTKGISIFIVPKVWVNPDGSLGERNDIVCTGTEEKMGIHASATCTMSLGSKGTCRGMLLGEENQGMRIMFHMMNEARQLVGFQAFSYASSAYLYAADYARQRVQGKDLAAGKNPDAPSVTIVNHPDVRRMLTWMKAHVEGLRSLIYYTHFLSDIAKSSQNDAEKTRCNRLIDFLTPIVKGYSSQRSFDVCIMAMQVFGGYGYTKEYPVEQLARDCKICSIYEGTDGIQAIDLLGRKITLENGQLLKDVIEDIEHVIQLARESEELSAVAAAVADAVSAFQDVANELKARLSSKDFKLAFAHAFSLLEVTGDIVMAWMLLWRAAIASRKLKAGKDKKNQDYYEGQLKTAEFFAMTILPVTLGKMNSIKQGNGAVVDMPESCFG